MKKILIYGVFLSLLLIVCVRNTAAAVKINEVYPAPLAQSGDPEWIELYNDDNTTIDVSNYTLTDSAKQNKITFDATSIGPFDFITASSSNTLNNSGPETISLTDDAGNVLESVSYSNTFTSNDVLVKCPDGNGAWFTLTSPTKDVSNQTACLVLTPTPTPLPTDTPTPVPSPTVLPTTASTPTVTPTSYNDLYLSEVMPYPNDNDNEWVELYNDNTFQVTLIDWYLDDGANTGSSPKLFSTTIGAKNYAVVESSSSFFNNSGDTVRLLDFNQVEKHSFVYTVTTKGQTYGRDSLSTSTFCLQTPTKGSANTGCPSTTTSTAAPTATSTTAQTASQTSLSLSPTTISPTPTPSPSSKAFLIVVDSHPLKQSDQEEIVKITEAGTVLGAAADQLNPKSNPLTALAYVQALSVSSIAISLLNIGYIFFRMKQRLLYGKT